MNDMVTASAQHANNNADEERDERWLATRQFAALLKRQWLYKVLRVSRLCACSGSQSSA